MCSARYAFFRDPTGQPCRKDEGKHAPENLLRVMGECSILQGDGNIAWQNLPFDTDLIDSSIAIIAPSDEELNEQDSSRIVWNALRDANRKCIGKPIKPSELLKACDNHASAFFRLPKKSYHLIASLSLGTLPSKRIKVRNSTIHQLTRRAERYQLPKVLDSPYHRDPFDDHLKSTRYRWVRVDTAARSVDEALNNALDDLNLARSLWSFCATRGIRTLWFASKRRPIGVIHTGPLYTLHHTDGSAANDDFYYFDPDYSKDLELFDDRGQWQRIERDRVWATRRLRQLPFGNDLRLLFLRYVAALDEIHEDVACLRLWSILEKITDTVGAQYDVTIKRASWIYAEKDRPLIKETLEAFRQNRNRFVHSGITGQRRRNMASLIKQIIEPHLIRLLKNSVKLKSLKEYGEFLSYPTDVNKLRQMRQWSSLILNRPK